MTCSRLLTPFFAVLVATSISAGDQPEGEGKEPPRPPAPEKIFERLDADKDQALSRAEFIHGMVDMRRRAQQGGDKPGADGDGKRPPRPERPPGEDQDKGEGDGKCPPAHPPKEGKEGEGKRPPGGEQGNPLEGAFDKADADKSGTLTLEEFKAALKNRPRPPARQ